jgi:hypothetical protein
MALAILQLVDRNPAGYSFRIDTGSSPWWELLIGEAVGRYNSLEVLDGVQLKMPIKGPEPNNLKTGRIIHLDSNLFDEKKRFIQLVSYKTRDKKGPGYSDVVEVVPRLKGKFSNYDELPEIKLPQNLTVMTATETNRYNRISVQESVLSAPMSFAALLPMLTNLLPLAGSLLGGLFNKGGGGKEGAAGPDLKSILTPENLKAITDMITQLMQQNKTATAKSLPGAVSPTLLGASAAVIPILTKLITPEAIAALGTNPEKLYAAIADAIVNLPDNELIAVKQKLATLKPMAASLSHPPTVYSEAKIAPALLAALPALMPLLEKAMDPNMINAIGDQPNKLLNTIQNGFLNMNKEQNRYLEAILPKGVNLDDALKQMIGSINTYNAVTHMPGTTPAQPVAQSLAVNALYASIPIVEKLLDGDVMEEMKENTKEIAEKICNELIKMQKELKNSLQNISPSIKASKAEGLSYFMEHTNRASSGSAIFQHSKSNSAASNQSSRTLQLLTTALSIAATGEYCKYKKENDQQRSFTRSLTTEVTEAPVDPATSLLLQKIKEAEASRIVAMSSSAGKEYSLDVAGSQKIDINGVAKVVYVKEKGVGFVLKINAAGQAGDLSSAMVEVKIKGNDNKKILASKKFKLSDVKAGQLTEPLRFEPNELEKLPVEEDLLVNFAFAWKVKNEIKVCRKTHSIMITDGYTLGKIGEAIKTGIPLNNVHEHRNFWHKVWQSGTSSSRTRLNISCKYFMRYDPSAPQNSFLQTKTLEQPQKEDDVESTSRNISIKMKSGMDLSPLLLNQLLPQVSNYPSLSIPQLKALRTFEFGKGLNTVAQSTLAFRNKEGESSSLWVYPEVDLVKMTLKKANGINAFGNVLDTKDEEVVFLRPSSIHFIGTKN